MTGRYVHLGINPQPGEEVAMPPAWNAALEDFLTAHVDWYRFGAQNYVLCTDAELHALQEGIHALSGFEHMHLFLSDVHAYHGWTHPDVLGMARGKRW